MNAITGAGGVKIDIRFTPTEQQSLSTGSAVVPMDHYPSWKLQKNPFWRVKHPNSKRKASMAPAAPALSGGDPNAMMMAAQERTIFAYEQHQDVGGMVTLYMAPGKQIEHLGIKIQFIGRIDMSMSVNDHRPHYDFVSLSKELAPPGVLYQQTTEIPFFFRNMDKEHESYRGRNVSVRYFVKVVLERKFLPTLQKEHDIWIQVLGNAPAQNEAIKMEVGIEVTICRISISIFSTNIILFLRSFYSNSFFPFLTCVCTFRIVCILNSNTKKESIICRIQY